MDSYVYHHGIKGQKWGIRRYQNKDGSLTPEGKKRASKEQKKEKVHLGIDDHGNINLIRHKTTAKAKKAFVIKTAMFLGSMVLTSYIATHPDVIESGRKACQTIIKKKTSVITKPVTSGIFSKTLGRELTISEALEAGFDLSD